MSKLKDQSLALGDYIIDSMKPFASGAFSKAYRCRKKTSDSSDYVAKEVSNKHDDIIVYEKKMLKVLEEVKSKYVLRYKKVVEKKDATYFITRFCNCGDLEKYLATKVFFPLWELQIIFPGLVESLSEIHKVGIIHRDIKAANFFLHRPKNTGRMMAILADYGFAKYEKGSKSIMASTVLGTAVTMAPEVWNNEPYEFSADVWSLGAVLYNLCFGSYPFESNVKDKLRAGKYVIPGSFAISGDYIKLIEHCLQVDPKKRPKAGEIYALYPGIKQEKKQDLLWTTKNITLHINKMIFRETLEKYVKSDYNDTSLGLEVLRRGTD